MDAEVIAALVAGGLLVIAKLVEVYGTRQRHTLILREAEILAALPEDSTSRATLLVSLDERIRALTNETGKTRYPLGIILGIAFVGLGAWLGYLAVETSTGWSVIMWVGAAIAAIFGASGIAIYFPKRQRGQNGAVLEQDT